MPVRTNTIVQMAFCLSAANLAAGCSSSDARAQNALTAYQAAAASNDMVSARRALLELVRAKDDVPDYWAELGKVQASMGSYSDAYYAFTRAYELNRSDPNLLRAVVGLALRSGDIETAQTRAHELDVVSPGDPLVKITSGWAAITETRYADALEISNSLLATSPFDSSGTVLKARALLGLRREQDALDLLVKQVQAQPSDVASLGLLSKIYIRREDWRSAAATLQRLTQLTPTDVDNWLLLIEAAFRSGDVPKGRAASAHLLGPNAPSARISSVLQLWADFWQSPQRIQDARKNAEQAAGAEQKIAYAAFLSTVGSPADAIRLASATATLPVNARNAEANAVLASALARLGKLPQAKARFDAVIAFDPGNATALRGRSELELQTGNPKAAILDAQKLTTVQPQSSRDRLLLARCFAVDGNQPWAQRTLWAAFRDIPGDETIYGALRATRHGDADAIRELDEEFARQRDQIVGRGLA